MKRRLLVLLAVALLAGAGYVIATRQPSSLVLTGIVATHDVAVSSQVDGRLAQLNVSEGEIVPRDAVLATIDPEELRADSAYYSSAEQGVAAQVSEAEAALHYQRQQTDEEIRRAESNLSMAEAQRTEAAAALENARLEVERVRALHQQGIASGQDWDQARTAHDAARARVDALTKQVDAQKAALALARANAQQVAVKRSQLQNTEHLRQAAAAQRAKADVRLGYAEVRAPIAGIVDVRAARVGEVITRGQPILTLINPDDLWVRVDVEETYIDRVRLGQHLTVRLPSGDERDGVVIFRGVDAGFATQRDVSRTKRDIKTFEVRVRTDNRDRRLALGMTAYVQLPLDR